MTGGSQRKGCFSAVIRYRSWRAKDLSGLLQGTLLLQAVSITPALAAGEELPADEAAIMLDSVTVTARKRGETEFDVPISMGVIREKQAELIPPASSNANLARMVPNFNFLDSGGQYTNAGNIRGVGSFSPLSSDDTSIVFNVDEIPLSAYGVPPVLMDIERVEVLRGPQGTLYGRNTQGGAINIVTNRPQFGPELSVRMEGGSRDYGLGELIVNDALNDNLAGRLAIRYSEQNGDVRNNASGDKDGAAQIGALRGSLLFVPDEETSALLTLSYNRNDDQSPRFILRDSPVFRAAASTRAMTSGAKATVSTCGLVVRWTGRTWSRCRASSIPPSSRSWI
ncbi:TonB-dependent receptor [Azorhizophilus paspali]|uniref:TonB-dependent receptor n=1 Tax=Azorhizophilus paspali TaxID=69963 RepID=UPI003642898A